MIIPIIDYADIIYGAAPKTKLAELQVHQNKCLRTCNKVPPLLNRIGLHKKYRVLPMRLRREQHIIKFAFKRSLDDKYVDNRNINTRAHDSRLLKTFFTRKAKVQKGVEFMCASLWNALENNHRESADYGVFRDLMRKRYDEKLLNILEI